MRRALAAPPLFVALFLSACGPAGVVANSVIKETQGGNAADIERDIKVQFGTTPSLRDVKVSVAISNVWRDAFQTRYSVLLAGTVPDTIAHTQAIATVRKTIGANDDTILIADRIRVTAPPITAD